MCSSDLDNLSLEHRAEYLIGTESTPHENDDEWLVVSKTGEMLRMRVGLGSESRHVTETVIRNQVEKVESKVAETCVVVTDATRDWQALLAEEASTRRKPLCFLVVCNRPHRLTCGTLGVSTKGV